MEKKDETRQDRLARLKKQLADLQTALPEHCHGTDGFISVHRATPDQLEKIEELEEEIKRLKAETGG